MYGVSTVAPYAASKGTRQIKNPGSDSMMLRVDVVLVSLTRYGVWLGMQISDSGSTRPANGLVGCYTLPACPS